MLPPLIVLLDINVYLDVGRWLGPPYSLGRLNLGLTMPDPQPTPLMRVYRESSRLVAICNSGNYTAGQKLQVWSSTWIASQTIKVAARPTSVKGLGWTGDHAYDLYKRLIYDSLVVPTNGTILETNRFATFSGLSPDDAQVLSSAFEAKDCNVDSKIVCVTNDKDFRDSTSCQGITMLSPSGFLLAQAEARSNLK